LALTTITKVATQALTQGLRQALLFAVVDIILILN
jgi:hypothetical protein